MISTVYIAKNVYGGDGLGRLGDGRVVFVPGAWAGEQVRAEIVEEKRHFVRARLVEVVEASPDRVRLGSDRVGIGSDRVGVGSDRVGIGSDRVGVGSDRVGVGSDRVGVGSDRVGVGADRVGVGADKEDLNGAKDTKGPNDSKGAIVPGMVYSTLSFAGEMKAKESQLCDFFERTRIAFPPIERHVSSFVSQRGLRTADVSNNLNNPNNQTIFNYRNKVVYHFAKQRGKWVIGYRTEPAHEIVDVESDPLARPEINAKLPEVRRSVLTLLTTGPETVRRDIERKGNVTVRWTAKSGVKWWIGEPPAGLVLKETTCGRDFDVPADGFYQVNPEVGEELVKAVVAEYQKGADVAPDVLDLYCGVGVFGLCCNPPRLTGIESGRQAIDFAKRNAAAQKFANARFYAEQVGRNLKRISINAHTTVIVDPPRDGMEPNVPKWLADSKAPRILYVSCDPATLMRDLKTICRTYDVESVRWFNMFPRTARFETLVVLKKRI